MGTAGVLMDHHAQIGLVLLGRGRISRRFTDHECDLLNGILPILEMAEAAHACGPAARANRAPRDGTDVE